MRSYYEIDSIFKTNRKRLIFQVSFWIVLDFISLIDYSTGIIILFITLLSEHLRKIVAHENYYFARLEPVGIIRNNYFTSRLYNNLCLRIILLSVMLSQKTKNNYLLVFKFLFCVCLHFYIFLFIILQRCT